MATAILVSCVLFFFRDAILYQKVFYETDTDLFYYPLLAHLSDLWRLYGELPLWSPYFFLGFPVFADGEAGIFYPLNLLALLFLPPEQGFIWLGVARLTLAGLFMYAYGRALGVGPFGSLIAALVFVFGSFFVGQLHHTNLSDSSIWLPLILCFIELALRVSGGRRFQYLVLVGLAFGLSALGVHIQGVLTSLLVVVLYVLYRVLFGAAGPPSSGERWFTRSIPLRILVNLPFLVVQKVALVTTALALVITIGFGLAAIQLVPMYELAKFSARTQFIDYQFATTYSMPRQNLVELLFPYLMRSQNGSWWGLWSQWETAVYVGIAPLILAGIGFVFVRNRYTFFFSALAGLGLLLAMGAYAPSFLNPHWYLWHLPGFEYLRAPGRFAYIFVFSSAVLAGWGTNWLATSMGPQNWSVRRRNGAFGLYLLLVSLTPLVLVAFISIVREWLKAFPEVALKTIATGYLSLPRGNVSLTAQDVYQGLLHSMSLWNPKTVQTILLLVVAFLLLFLWYEFRRPAFLWKGLLLGIIAWDLLSFASAFHPSVSLRELASPSNALSFLMEHNSLYRIYNKGGKVASVRSNQGVSFGVASVGGYSSLGVQRHAEYVTYLHRGRDVFNDVLLDLAGVRYIVTRNHFTPFPSIEGTSFDPSAPMLRGSRSSANSRGRFTFEPITADSVGVIAALSSAVQIPQGAPVAEIILEGEEKLRLELLAGTHLSEWAYDRTDVKGKVKHKQARKAHSMEVIDLDGLKYNAYLYYSVLPLRKPTKARSLEFRYLYPEGQIKVYGLSLQDSASGRVGQVRDREGYTVVYRDDEAVILKNDSPLPRAFLISKASWKPRSPRSLLEILEGSVDPRTSLVLEREPGSLAVGEPAALASNRPSAPAFFKEAKIVNYSPRKVAIQTDAEQPAFLVLTDSYYPGWNAILDGVSVPIYQADYLFRAVSVPKGRHTVEFIFEPESLALGVRVSALGALLGAVVCLIAQVRILADRKKAAGQETWTERD